MLTAKLLASVIGNVVVFGALLFIPAGTFAWPRAWIFLAVVLIATSLTMFLIFSRSEELLNERFKPPIQKGQPLADRILITALVLSFTAFTAFIPHDVFYLHLTHRPGALVSSLGLALFVAGWTIMSLSFRENAFAAPVVKHQAEREQRVIDTGIYRVVRHPLYAGAIPLMVGMPLWLQSYAGAMLALIPISVLVVRVLIEENFLRRELPGYDSYTHRVRYRLIPFVW